MTEQLKDNEVIDLKVDDICEDFKQLGVEDHTRRRSQRKSSFVRFGDDLTELILQYLSLKDKFRLECVSKQWRDLIYNKVFVIDMRDISRRLREDSRQGRIQSLKTKEDHRKKIEILFGKCPHVYRITSEKEFILETLIESIGRYCSRLKSMDFNVKNLEEKEILDFARSNGQKLESLGLYISLDPNPEKTMKSFLGYCSKLKTITYIKCWDNGITRNYSITWYFDCNDPTYLPELRHIVPRLYIEPLEGPSILQVLADKNGQIMKSIKLYFFWYKDEFIDVTFKQLIRMKNLQSLSFQFDHSFPTTARKLSELIGHLPKLKRFELIVSEYNKEEIPILADISMIINALVNIEKLIFKFNGNVFDVKGEPRDYNFTSLRKLTKLKRLEMAFERYEYRIYMFSHSFFGSNITLKNIPEVKVEILNGIKSQGIKCQNVIAFGNSLAKVYPNTNFEVNYIIV